MQINKIQQNNQPNFGIKFINKNAWNKDVLNAFENSKVFKEINEKYPEAKVYYTKISGEESIANSEIIHTLIMDIELAKNKLFRWNLSSHNEFFPEQHLKYELKTLNLKNIENSAAEMLSPIMSIQVNYKQNPIKAFFNKLFSKNIF